jgi:nitrogen fixation protein NifQ
MFAARYASLIAAQRPVWSEAEGFDAHAVACAMASAPCDCAAALPDSLGLSGRDTEALLAALFPALLRGAILAFDRGAPRMDCEETDMLAGLLEAHRAGASPASRWLARIIARRALEPGHLWLALGLSDRGELRRLLARHFPVLAARNTGDMRWKKFFYRELCASQGYVACPVPDCRDCSTFAECFGPEDGVSLMAAA